MEGLPVRQWQKRPAAINTAPPKDTNYKPGDRNSIWSELPMPKGSELYSDLSRRLLRAARAPRNPGQSPKPTEEDKEVGDEDDAEGELDTGFTAMRWSQVPRDLEQPEPEFLAKRRKGLPSIYGATTGAAGKAGTMRKTKVKKVDNEGNTVFLDVLVPEGTVVEGEVAEGDETLTEAPAPGTVVEGIGVANAEGIIVASEALPTPPRRRPPPPKRKPKGPGRGRKKKVAAENGLGGIPTASNTSGPQVGLTEPSADGLKVPGNVPEGVASTDVEMGDDSVIQDGEEGSEEDDDEGDEGEDGDREEGEVSEGEDSISRSASPTKPKSAHTELLVSTLLAAGAPQAAEPTARDLSSSPDLPLAAGQIPQAPTITVEQVPDNITTATTVSLLNSSPHFQDVIPPNSIIFDREHTQEGVTVAEFPVSQQSAVEIGTKSDMTADNHSTQVTAVLTNDDSLLLGKVPQPAFTVDADADSAVVSTIHHVDADAQIYPEAISEAVLENSPAQQSVADLVTTSKHVLAGDVSSLKSPVASFEAPAPFPCSPFDDSIEQISKGETRNALQAGQPRGIVTVGAAHPETAETESAGETADVEEDLLGSLEKHLDSKSA